MAQLQKYKYYANRPSKLTAAFAKKEYAKLLARLPTAESNEKPHLWIELFTSWNALEGYIGSEFSRIGYEYSKDLTNKKLDARQQYLREKISPVIDQPEHQLVKAFINSRHRSAIAKRFGEQLIPAYKTALKPLDPVNTPLNIKIGNLYTKYEKIIGGAKIKLGDKTLNLWGARALQHSDDPQVRESAFIAVSKWFVKNQAKLAKIYDEQVKLRDQAAKNLKYKNYIPLAYESRGRQGYGEAEVAQFRQLVLKHLVPLFQKIAASRAKQMSQASLKPWDIHHDPARSIPLGTVPVNKQFEHAQAVFDRLSPILAKHFKVMRDKNLIDLETRPNKQSGAYCTAFQDEDKVAIFLNSTGDPDDVRVLMHEMGHAFQFWESQHIESVDLQVGTAELAEVYSMGMEFLSLPYMDEFFSEQNAKKYSQYKWVDSIYTICYVCVVDEFQHWVYKNPGASLQARDKAWAVSYAKYLPFVDFTNLEKYLSVRWYAQSHIFGAPFYYIDYALAETCAMQLGVLAAEDHSKTVKKYLQMCQLGGTESFLDTLKSTNLRSPFEEQLIIDLKKQAEKILF